MTQNPQEDPGLQELVQDFVTESREHLANVESDLLILEQGGGPFEDTVNRVFRAVHSVKGVAGFLGFENINRLAHAMESVFDLVRKDRLGMSPDLVSTFLSATDLLRDLLEHVQESNQRSIQEAVTALQVFLGAAGGPSVAAPSSDAGAPVAGTSKVPSKAAFVVPDGVNLAPGERLLGVSLVVPSVCMALHQSAEELQATIGALGRVVAGATQLCTPNGHTGSREPVAVLLATSRTGEEVRQALVLEATEVQELRPAVPLPKGTSAATGPRESSTPVAKPGEPQRAGHAAAPSGGEAHVDSIRVSVHLLDRLMNLSGELVLGRNQLLQAHSASNAQGVAVASARLDQVVGEVQEAIMQTRMQPVGNLFQRFPRVVRDLAGKLGKRCRLELEGGGVELDRSILEALSDPLTHLVRNAIDHGMEPSTDREAAGKHAEGTVQLAAAQQGGNVRITITDDGRGIDPARLRKKAVEKGVLGLAEAQAMSDREAVHLIFAPGFSTAEKVTDVSGRGVGMDVVRSNIERLGGHVDVHSTVGRGTTIAITIPLTLAILPAMVLRCGERRYVLAQANVAELVRCRSGQDERLVQLDGREVLRLRGQVLPLLRLRRVLGADAEASPDGAAASRGAATIVVVEAGSLRYGLVVDAPPDAEEIVVKPLGRHLKGRVEYAGATILGDGRVAMILDAAGIAESSQLGSIEATEAERGSAAAAAVETTELVLFTNHPNETFGVPLGLLDRIQRVEVAKLTEIGGRLVHADGDTVLPVVRLERAITATPPQLGTRASILVLRTGQQRFGLLAPDVEDIRSLPIELDGRTLAETGVLGSFRLEGRTVRWLDVAQVARTALPGLFADAPAEVASPGAAPRTGPDPRAQSPATRPQGPIRVLFAEDTKFFREHVAGTLRGAGFEVVTAADGDLAWQVVNDPERTFDVVVTDVQMPNCDGLELTRRIRRTERLRSLPVVALTSLSSAEDEAAGTAAGVDAYLVKLDDAALVAAVREHSGVEVA
ncbi:MAG: chemotaxis protein CheW [Planctomycetes bacterium]|nr:chemotaxis protein CheW [Planctomycetota bacterium]